MEKKGENVLGILAWSFGLASLILSITQPIAGILFGIVGLIMNSKQTKKGSNEWARAGKILSIIGIIVSIIATILIVVAFGYLSANPELLAQYG